MSFTTPQNPWGLTQAEVDTLDAVTQTGSSKLAAAIRGRAYQTVRGQFDTAMRKMGAPNHTMAVLTWDRLRRAA